MKRKFIDKDKREFIYDSDIPEILPVSGESDITVQKFFLTDTAPTAYTPILPENASQREYSLDEVLTTPSLEAYCTPEFWTKLKGDDWIKILAQYDRKKDYLLIHAPEDFWKNLTVGNWLSLLKQNRFDLLNKDSRRSSMENFSAEDWIKLLTAENSKYSEFFKYCPKNIWCSFSEEQCETLLLGAPDYYCKNLPDNWIKKTSLEFWIKNICSGKTGLKPEHFPRNKPIAGHVKNTNTIVREILKQDHPDFSLLTDDDLTIITDEQWLRFSEKNFNDFKSRSMYSEKYQELKWYVGYWRSASLLSGATAFLCFALAALFFGAGISLILGGSIVCGAGAALFWSLTGKTFFLDKKQSIWTGITGGIAIFAVLLLSLLSPSRILMFLIPAICAAAGIFCWRYGLKKGIINCRSEEKDISMPLLSVFKVGEKVSREKFAYAIPGLSICIALIALGVTVFSMWYPAGHCLKIAANFRTVGMKNAKNIYMERYIARHNLYQKKLKEFHQELEKHNTLYALSAYEALAGVWDKNPLLVKLADEYIRVLQQIKPTHSRKNIDELVRARNLFRTASDKSISDLVDLELDLRSKQLAENLKTYQKAASYASIAHTFDDWQNKLQAIKSLDKNYSSLNNLQAGMDEIHKQNLDEIKKKLQDFEKTFDKKFPPEKYLASLRKELPCLNDMYNGFPQHFTEYHFLKYAWLLTLHDRKSGLAILKQASSGAPAFLHLLVANGTRLEELSKSVKSDIFTSLVLRKPAEAEKFIRYLLDRYNFAPEQLYYLLASSQKAQKKPFAVTLETAILNDLPDLKGLYLAWNSEADMKIPVLEKIVSGKMQNWMQAASILGDKYLQQKAYQKSYNCYIMAGSAAGFKDKNINRAYFESNKNKINESVRQFNLEFDRIYTNSSTCRPPVGIEYKRCYEFLSQDFMWRYAWAIYQHSTESASRNEARVLLEKIKSPESVYLLAKINNGNKELPIDAVNAGTSASFRKIRLEATKYKLTSSRFSPKEKIDGIKYLFEEGELSSQEKLYAGQFLFNQKDLMSARKIFDSLPDSGDKSYQLFLCDFASGNQDSAHRNLIVSLQQGYPVPYDKYKLVEKTDNKGLMTLLVKNKGPQYQLAALELARLLAREKDWLRAAIFFQQADTDKMTAEDKGNYGFALWERGEKTSSCFEMCMTLPDERIGSDLAWNIHLYLEQKNDLRAAAWLKNAADKGSPDAENKKYLQLRRDDSVENVAEKNKLWKNCIQRGFKEAIIDAVEAFSMDSPCPVSKEVIVRSGEHFFNRLSPADQKKYSWLKNKIAIIKEL